MQDGAFIRVGLPDVMIACDVRTLAREYCGRGVPVQYNEYASLDHVETALVWIVDAYAWLLGRFAHLPAPRDCSTIAPGNLLAPLPAPG